MALHGYLKGVSIISNSKMTNERKSSNNVLGSVYLDCSRMESAITRAPIHNKNRNIAPVIIQ